MRDDSALTIERTHGSREAGTPRPGAATNKLTDDLAVYHNPAGPRLAGLAWSTRSRLLAGIKDALPLLSVDWLVSRGGVLRLKQGPTRAKGAKTASTGPLEM